MCVSFQLEVCGCIVCVRIISEVCNVHTCIILAVFGCVNITYIESESCRSEGGVTSVILNYFL